MENGAHLIEHTIFLHQSLRATSHISTHYLLRLQPSKTDGLQYYYIAYNPTNPYSRVPQPFSSSLLSYSPRPLGAAISQLQSKRIYNKECTWFVLHSPSAGSEYAKKRARRFLRSLLLNQPPIRCSQPLLSSLGILVIIYHPLRFTHFHTHR